MAQRKSRKDLIADLHDRGLRKRVARSVADALGSGTASSPPVAITRTADSLRSLAGELEERATGRTAKRRAAARKAARTRARNAEKRSTAAKKGARKRG